MRDFHYTHTIRPSVEYLADQGRLLLDGEQMAAFLGVGRKALQQLVYSDRIPLPVRLGLGKCPRWSVLELLEWVEAGCPRRTAWIKEQGGSGWYPPWR